MKQEFFNLEIKTNGQDLYEITDKVSLWIEKNNFKQGLINLSILHTSASLIILNYFDKLAPMNKKLYNHITEGKDDMPAHIKSTLTNNQISLSIKNGALMLGTWQGIYLFEHRLDPLKRTINCHYLGI